MHTAGRLENLWHLGRVTTIREYTDAVQAGLARSFLEDNQIEAVLADENTSAWIGARLLIPIRLQVPEDRAEEALRLLDAPAGESGGE
jgi:hypothetical protein